MAEREQTKQREPTDEALRANLPPYGGTPRWVKASGIILITVILLVGILLISGIGSDHGPDRHRPSNDAGGYTPPIVQGV